MKAARAKRHALRWARYIGRMPAGAGRRRKGGIYWGHANAYARYTETGRAAPTGIRVPWIHLAIGIRRR